MTQKIYAIEIEACEGYNANDIDLMLPNDRRKFVEQYGDGEAYTLEGFLYYLNEGMLDTENYYYVLV